MTDQPVRTPDARKPSTRTEPRDPVRTDHAGHERDRESPLLREGSDAPDAADIEDPEHQR
jgi:hypothetical protein